MKRIITLLIVTAVLFMSVAVGLLSLAADDAVAGMVDVATAERTATDIYLDGLDAQAKARPSDRATAGAWGALIVLALMLGGVFWLARLRLGAEYAKQTRLGKKQKARGGKRRHDSPYIQTVGRLGRVGEADGFQIGPPQYDDGERRMLPPWTGSS